MTRSAAGANAHRRFPLPAGLTRPQAQAVVDRLVYSVEGVEGVTLDDDASTLLVSRATAAAAARLPGLVTALAGEVLAARVTRTRRLRWTEGPPQDAPAPAASADATASARAELHRLFDLLFLDVALRAGARERRYPALVGLDVMRRCRYVELFPQNAYLVDELPHQRDILVRMREGGATAEELRRSSGYMLNPALCFHTYAEYAGTRVTGPLVLTAAGECFRHEAHWRLDGYRRASFTMREIPIIGSSRAVERLRGALMDSVWDVFTELGLRGRIETATDPFYYAEDSTYRQHQLLAGLKYELLAQRPGGATTAIASFNNVGDTLCRQFGIHAGEEAAHSGCVAFGIDRWAELVLESHGADPAGWPEPLRRTRRPAQVTEPARGGGGGWT